LSWLQTTDRTWLVVLDDHQATVAATWSLSIEAADHFHPED
jgi:hypothetical protein